MERPDSGVGHRGISRRARLDDLVAHGEPLLVGARIHSPRTAYSGNVDQNWKGKVCIKNVVDCNQNFPTINFTEFTTWGSSSYNGTDQPGWGIKNDLSYIRRLAYLEVRLPAPEPERQRLRAAGYRRPRRFQLPEHQHSGQHVIPGERRQFVRLVPARATHTSGAPKPSAMSTQKYRYFGFYAQDDWRISRKLTINLGVRYDVTLPPVNANGRVLRFQSDPPESGAPTATRARCGSPASDRAARIRAASCRAGTAASARGSASPMPSMTRPPSAPGSGARFSRVTAVQGSGHFAGFIGQYQFDNTSQGVTADFQARSGTAALQAAALDRSVVLERQHGGLVAGAGCHARAREPDLDADHPAAGCEQHGASRRATTRSVGTHMQSGILNYNQVPTPVYDRMVAQFGADAGAQHPALEHHVGHGASRRASRSRIRASTSARTVAQALRPFPQYTTISTGPQNGDKSGHSSYHALTMKLDRRLSQGLTLQWNYVLSKLLTDSDTYFANSATPAMDQYNRRLEKSIGQFDQTHVFKFSTLYDLPFGKGRKWMNHGFLTPRDRRLAHCGDSGVQQRRCRSRCSATTRCRSSTASRGR